MMKLNFKIHSIKTLGDLTTPVQLYLKLRDAYPNALLLEGADYHSKADAHSFICLRPLANFEVNQGEVIETFPKKTEKKYLLTKQDLVEKLEAFSAQFSIESSAHQNVQGLFGYLAWDALPFMEKLSRKRHNNPASIPEVKFSFYQNIVVFNHFHNEIEFIEFYNEETVSEMARIQEICLQRNFTHYPFQTEGEMQSNLEDEDFIQIVSRCKEACYRGDVFQIVPSRQFQQGFTGDEFNVYRSLRSINPSPYLFYFDYGNYKIFGSSPEAQIIIQNRIAQIHPIAGTVRRTGNLEKDSQLTDELIYDPKENEEHVMLVDLARNDLSKNAQNVEVESYKEVQYFSHVIHLVSKVTAELEEDASSLQVLADSFPAGTLSGAPKYKALQLLEEFENQNRGIYGGTLGFLGFNGDINMAIVIRSFISKNHTLYFQAGAGIVSKSIAENELQEVNHKLGALRRAIEQAKNIVS
ncbi:MULTISPECIES: anthranilate synthase component I family protein [Weeksella]|uniref:anthranilate synthase component I family protein n=1 Tax=Weeksella TaxID=1013 RepID=UPI0009F3E27E|nr:MULTISPECIES: anthranilate synthase component I family protein [Weeksella]MDK7375407.1 anthranilate synthase component I family protein [Weeksella virosa]